MIDFTLGLCPALVERAGQTWDRVSSHITQKYLFGVAKQLSESEVIVTASNSPLHTHGRGWVFGIS